MNDQPKPSPEGMRPQPMSPSPLVRPSNAFVEFPTNAVEQSIPQRFEEQVALHGERTALATTTETLSYAALNRQANRIARALLPRCNTSDTPIAVLLPPTEAVVAMLGVLKAGKAYVVLDPAYPQARLAHVLADAQAQVVVITTASLSGALAANDERLLLVDRIDPVRLKQLPDDVYRACQGGQVHLIMDFDVFGHT